MIKKMKKAFCSFIATLLSIALILAGLPITAQAEGGTGTTGIWKWIVLEDGTLSITGCTAPSGDLILPESLDTGSGPVTVTRIESNAFKVTNPIFFPSQIKTFVMPDSVTSVGDSAFTWCNSLTSVTFSSNLTNIGASVFSNCSALTSITIPDSVQSIGSAAFSNCSGLVSVTLPNNAGFTAVPEKLFWGDGSLKTTNIASLTHITSIGSRAFIDAGIESMILPDSITDIGAGAFEACRSLKSITLPDNTDFTNIPDNMFAQCNALESILIPKSVTFIGAFAFEGCYALAEITVDAENTQFSSEDGVLYNAGKTLLILHPAGRSGELDIPDSVTKIGNYAFLDSAHLSGVSIPEGATEIGDYAFMNCRNTELTRIDLPESVKSIGANAFQGCGGLTSINIPEGVEVIGPYTFNSCGRLSDVSLPDSLEVIGDFAFLGCDNLNKVTIPRNVTSIGSSAFSFCTRLAKAVILGDSTTFGSDVFKYATAIKNTAIPSNGIYGFAGSTAQTYAPANGIAFYSLYTVSFETGTGSAVPDIITATGSTISEPAVPTLQGHIFGGWFKDVACTEEWIFDSDTVDDDKTLYAKWTACTPAEPGATGVTDIWYWMVLGDGTLSITGCTYGWFEDLNLTVPASLDTGSYGILPVTGIGNEAFNGRTRLMSITLPSGLKNIGDRAFGGCSGLTGIALPIGLTTIGEEAFNACQGLTEITLPDGLISIGNGAFSACYNLKTIVMSDTITSIGREAFASCGALSGVTLSKNLQSISDRMFVYCTALQDIHIPAGVDSIGSLVFEGSGLKSIVIPDTVTSISSYAFQGCSSLESVTLPDNATFTSIPEGLFFDCTALKNVTIPSQITSISSNTFYNCGFTSFVIPETITEIGKSAFQNCKSLASVTLPDNTGFTHIPDSLFLRCSDLQSIIIPPQVTSIGQSAFGESGLTSITIPGKVSSIGGYAFRACPNLTAINVDADNTYFASQDGVLYNIGKTELISYPGGLSGVFRIPEGVMTIGKAAFTGCENLTEITMPNSLTRIGDFAFEDCTRLAKVIILSRNADFGEDVFGGTVINGDGLYGFSGSTAQAFAGSGIPFHIIVDMKAVAGITPPVRGAAPVTTITETVQYTGVIAWNPAHNPFAASTVYTATITLTPKAGYTLTGVGVNFFTIAGATSVSNPANSGVITVVFPATGASQNNNEGPDSGSGSSVPVVPAPTYTAIVKGTDTAGNGIPETTLPVTVDENAGSAALDAGSQQGSIITGGGTAVISVPSIPGVTSYTLGIPVAYLSTPDGEGTLTFNSDTGRITLPADMLAGIAGAEGKKAEITIGQGVKSGLSEAAKAAIANRPLIRLTVTLDGEAVEWNNPNAPVTISIPYTPTAAELASPEGIIIWYIDGSGKAVSVPNGYYDSATGTVTFAITHFSYYAVGYNKASFMDVSASAWYKKAVDFISARQITTGTGGGNFSPGVLLTRGEFLVMMMRAYGIAPDTNPKDNFSDSGNTYYTGYLAAAKRLDISGGVGNNMFAPEKEITRQEMFTLLYNALKVINRLPQGDTGKPLSAFSDAGQIASWAKDAMTLMVQTGIINGSGGKLFPMATTTRAEMAQVLYSLLSK